VTSFVVGRSARRPRSGRRFLEVSRLDFRLMSEPGGLDRDQRADRSPEIVFERVEVGPARIEHATGGEGPPAVFLHGWGIGPRSYGSSLRRLIRAGCRVLAPALPGFGGTGGLSGDDCSFCGYSDWLSCYLDAVGVTEPVIVVGHSFGGGVAIQFAHDRVDRVRAVVACNGVGGGGWYGFSDRPWWEWSRSLGSDLFAFQSLTRVLPAVIGQAVPNIVHNPLAMWRVSDIVRRADLRREVRVLKSRGVPLTMVWSDRDRLVSYDGFSAMCRAAGVRGVVVPGNHSWLIADPTRFADVIVRALVDAGVVEESLVRLTA
jgi:pimeloyl-ACP methyl ester carboxylesterase